jgi:CheY-like chemotaxis protein
LGQTVLVVEDTDMLRSMYSDRLEADGYRVLGAHDGAEALSVLRTDAPDLILLDLVMPRMSGLEVLELIKQDPRRRDIPVVILSNLGQEDDIKRGIELGAVDYIINHDSRPMDVVRRIGEILGQSADTSGSVSGAGGRAVVGATYQVYLRDHEADADRLAADADLLRRFWCPACEVELVLELVDGARQGGWYDAHLVCPRCARGF